MASFLALYRGRSVATADLVTVTTDACLIARFASEMLSRGEPSSLGPTDDPVRAALKGGEHRALELVRDEADGDRTSG